MAHCKWGTCNSDWRYREKDYMNNVKLFPFPKPCKYFYCEMKDPTIVVWHDRSTCSKCSLAMAWIQACKIEGFNKLEHITRSCYVCSKHFVDGEPNGMNPVPVSAGSFGKTTVPRKPPSRRVCDSQKSKTPDEAPISAPSTSALSNTGSTSASISPTKDDLKHKLVESYNKGNIP